MSVVSDSMRQLLVKAACCSRETKQCDPKCLSHSASIPLGECSERFHVWTLEKIEYERKRNPNGPLRSLPVFSSKEILITQEELLQELRRQCNAAGSVYKWATRHGIHRNFVYSVFKNERSVSPTICEALGYKRVLMFEKVENNGV